MSQGASPRRPTLVSLFAGSGGFDIALERAGFDTVVATDIDADCMTTLAESKAADVPVAGRPGRRHLERARLLRASVCDLSADDLRPSGAASLWRPDLLVGGPPCQPFSSSGRQRGVDDPRGRLLFEFVRLAGELRPHLVLFENVGGLVTAKTPDGMPGGVLKLFQRSFEEIGYATRFALLNAADYGAAQRRVRLYMLAATDRRLPLFPPPTHSQEPMADLADSRKPWVSLGEFLAGRPDPDPAEVVRPSGKRAGELAALTPGTGLRAAGIVEANRPGGHWGYRQDCFLADLELPARTIRAASTPDWIRLSDGSLRRLTWRECAALQSFPSEWRFSGTLASRFRQIGNAAQADIGEAIGVGLNAALQDDSPASPVSAPWPKAFRRRISYTAMEHATNGAHRAAAKRAKAV